MKIYVDADACPVIPLVEQAAKEHDIPVMLICDTSHILESDYSEIKMVGRGTDAVDFALLNLCKKHDIVVTQDYGLAAMALSKGAHAIHHSGTWYTSDNIDKMLTQRYMNKMERQLTGKSHGKRSKKRGKYMGGGFLHSLEEMIAVAQEETE